MSNDLTGVYISQSYGRLVQIVSGAYYDGFGNAISPPAIPSASYAITASYAQGGSGSFSGSFIENYVIVSSSYSASISDGIIEVVTAYVTQSLPTAIANRGKQFSFINASTGSIMIQAIVGQAIGNNAIGNDSYILILPEDAPRLISNNLNWRFI